MATRQVRIVVSDLRAFTERTVQRLVLNVNAQLVRTTPVDTGWARANWIPNIGGPFETTAGTREQAEDGQIDSATQQLGIAAVATSYSLPAEVHITNNVPYIEVLNTGTSGKAPAAFVEAAIFKAIRQTTKTQ